MSLNPWALAKDRTLRRLVISLSAQAAGAFEIDPQDGSDSRIVTLRHPELTTLRAHVYLHGQRPGTFGLFFEFPHPVPGILESEENQPLHAALDSLVLHFDATPAARYLSQG